MKFFIAFFTFALITTVCGNTIKFRSGEILAAEGGKQRPTLKNWNANNFGMDSATSYAAVAVRIHPKRKISIFDYTLSVNGVNHACVAIRTNNGAFEYTTKALTAEKGEIFTLLFFLKDVNLSGNQSAALVSMIPPRVNESVMLTLTNRYNGTLCPFSSIKKNGNF